MKARIACLVAIVATACASPLMAQADSVRSDTARGSLACASRSPGTRVSIGTEAIRRTSTTLDTTIVLHIDNRTWTRDDVATGVAFGANGTAGSRSAPWSVCTGASANLGRVTASLHGVNGQVHLRIDPSALSALVNPTAAPARQ